jgi:hypothetical protein
MLLWLQCVPARSAVVAWDGSSGLFPDQINPPFTLFDTAVANPTLSNGTLTLATTVAGNDILGYRQSGAQLSVPANLQIDARVHLVSGSSQMPNRAPIGIQFVPAPGVVNFLWIDTDTIFLNTAGDVRGPSASVDTDGGFHTYHIDVAGTTIGSVINVFYDGGPVPVLTGNLFSSSSTDPEISWGDLSGPVGGTSEWQHFEHNAAATPEPVAATLAAAGMALLCTSRPRRRHRPTPRTQRSSR